MKYDRQNGSIIVLTLLMLLFLQLVTVAVVSSANISSHVLRNFESALAVERSADNLINYLLGNKDYFVNYANYLNGDGEFTIPIPSDLLIEPAAAKISSFKCLRDSVAAKTISDTEFCGLNSKYWQLIVEVTSAQTGAKTQVVQGLKLTVEPPDSEVAKAGSEPQSDRPSHIRLQGVWWYAQ